MEIIYAPLSNLKSAIEMFFLFLGTPLTGQMDDVNTLQAICKEHNIWLHVTGPSLSTLPLVSTSSVVSLV